MPDNQNSSDFAGMSDAHIAHAVRLAEQHYRSIGKDPMCHDVALSIIRNCPPPDPAPATLNGVEGLVIQWRHNAQGCGRRDQHAAGTWRSCARELEAALRAADTNVTESNACRDAAGVCHCGTCTCHPGMTKAIRYDTAPAGHEDAIREHLIGLGWTPPGNTPTAVGEAITSNASLAGEAVAWAIRLGDGTISPFGWNGMPMLAGVKRGAKLVNGADYVFAYEGTHPPAAEVREVDEAMVGRAQTAWYAAGSAPCSTARDWMRAALIAALQKEKVND